MERVSSKMTILLLGDPNSIHNHKWINGLSKDFEIILACRPSDVESSEHPFQVHPCLPETYPMKRIDVRSSTIRSLKSIIDQHEVKLVHAIYLWHYGLWPQHLGLPFILTTWGTDVFGSLQAVQDKSGLSGWWERRESKGALENAAVVTCASQKQMEVIKGIAPNARVEWLPTGIDTTFFHSAAKQAKSTPFHFFSPRSMAPIYRIQEIILAASALATKETPIALTLIDDQADQEYSEATRALNHLSEFLALDFKEKLDAHAMKTCYEEADAVVMWPSSDGLPNSVLEAFSMHRMVVVPPLDYDASVINDSTAIIAKEERPQALEHAMRQAMDVDASDKLKQANEVVEKHASLSRSIERLTELYQTHART